MPTAKLLDMQALQIFVTTAEERNMSSTARRLGLTQSAVSQSIRQLEDQLGVVLFNRERRPLTLTPAGLALRNRGGSLLDDMTRLKAHVIDASRGIRPDVRVGLVDSFAGSYGPAFIKAMLAQSTTLAVRTGLTPYFSESLVGHDLDIVISTDPLADVDGIERRRLLSEQFVVITPKQYQGSVRTPDDLRALGAALPIIRFNRQSHMGAQIDRFLRRLEVRLPRRLEVDTADTLASMVAGDIGWAITTPLCLLQAADFGKRVKLHFISASNSGRSLYLLARKEEYSHFFDEVYAIAHSIMSSSLLKRLSEINANLPKLVEIEAIEEVEK
jgi:DNA-binding transcriptional LysR family regulator